MGERTQLAWLPLTPRSVAAFAHARVGRLLLVQFIVGLLCASVVGWFLYNECFPTVGAAIEKLPTEGSIHSAQLDWRGPSPQMLAEGSVLAFTVDLDHTGGLRPAADVQLEFGKRDYRVRSLLGIVDGKYPAGWVIAFNRTELKPLWGAWQPILVAGAIAGTTAWLMCCWWLLAAVYCLPVRLAGVFVNHDLNFTASWRLAGAALMPGAVLMILAILFFGLGMIDLVGLMFFFGVHFVVGWIYLFLSLLFVPKTPEMAALKRNPFADKQE